MRWLPGLLALVVLGALLSGCAQPKAAGADPSPTDAPGRDRTSRQGHGGGDEDGARGGDDLDNATRFSFADEFDLTVTAAAAIVGFGSLDGRNCVSVEGAPFRILGGNATVTWAAQTPAAEELTFTTQQVYGDYYYDQAPGTSPLQADIPKLPEALDDSWFTFSVDAGQLASVAYDQPVHVALAFEYEALGEVSVGVGC
jgi:hypothetical protein